VYEIPAKTALYAKLFSVDWAVWVRGYTGDLASSKPITLLKRVFSEPCTAMDIPAIAPIKRGIRAGFINVLLFVSNF
jgi:hypothetical protein